MPVAVILMLMLLSLAACSGNDAPEEAETAAPWVRTVAPKSDGQSRLELTGRVRARYEIPVAFQVDGRIARRHVDAGQMVTAGQLLFELDPKDLREALNAAQAAREAAAAALRTAQDELERYRDLLAKGFVGQQAYDRAALQERTARAQLTAAAADLERARNALGYAGLRADSPGVLIDVQGEPGQVVDKGQALALLAVDGEREIEVALPDGLSPPARGRAAGPDGTQTGLALREVAGAADPVSLTWRARYRLADDSGFTLGSVVRASFADTAADRAVFDVPIGALDERAAGPRIWRVVDGTAQPLPVTVVAMGQETARVAAELPDDARVVAFGTHLLTEGMAVREQAR
ncbi:MAG: efflux RND transporter periplasmic adaptor subunit [Thauera sp.]|nr:efflux RND transporter periplasmic adaptor subunit [Thauera sp.]